jgi:hypothetical protein
MINAKVIAFAAFLGFSTALLPSRITSIEGPAVQQPHPSPSVIPSADPDLNTSSSSDHLSALEVGRCGSLVATPNKAGKTYDDRIQFDNAGNFSEGLARVPIDGKCGYINLEGKQVIAAQFTRASDFRDGLAAILQGNQWGFVNAQGKIAIAPTFDRVSDFFDGVAIAQLKGKQGMIDRQGNWVIPPQFTTLSPFSEGLAVAQQSGKYGYIDRSGKFVIPPQFLSANDFHNGAARINSAWPSGVYFVNRQGQRINQPGQFSNAGEFSAGVAPVAIEQNGQERWGLIDPTGKLIVPHRFYSIEGFDDDSALSLVTLNPPVTLISDVPRDEGYAYIDRSGTVVLQVDFSAQQFNDGLALVMTADASGQALVGYINSSGQVVIAPTAELANPSASRYFSEGLLAFQRGQTWGYIDRTGNVAIAPRFDDADPFRQGRAKVRIGKRWAYIDRTGRIIAQQP